MRITSKLPAVGNSIFTVMSKMTTDYNAINLAQGFPEFPVAPELIDGIHKYMKEDMNQYAPMPGVPKLRENISKKAFIEHNACINMDNEITIVAGAIEGLMATIFALVHPGEEVIIIEPAFDAYVPIVELVGAKAVSIPLKSPDFSVDWDRIKDSISSKTRMILINSPHNPTGSILRKKDLEILAEIIRDTEIVILSDEVYEHLIFDGEIHQSVLKSDELRERSVVIYSFGKTFHATGWRVGYTIAPPDLTTEIRKVHQYMTFAAHTPTQLSIADYLDNPKNYETIYTRYEPKRDLFLKVMKGSGFEPIPCKGTYFQLMSYKGISNKPDTEMAEWITKKHGVSSIPISVFYQDKFDDRILRFCFAKHDETLERAGEILCKI